MRNVDPFDLERYSERYSERYTTTTIRPLGITSPVDDKPHVTSDRTSIQSIVEVMHIYIGPHTTGLVHCAAWWASFKPCF